jgi:alkanesulfonate monooxygenase SsuD/methylene tetrahydromethanopterin reductase-like flavin-dependent oxidoreductase (luciferase family)
MIWSDCYATLALAAQNTKRIQLGTGVAIPGIRIAPVTAHSIASINRIAPGRVFLGIGTGHTAMRVMGMQPMRVKEWREYLRVVRGLLRGDEVEYTLDGVTRAIRFLHLDLGFLDLEHAIPIYCAANGPLALRVVGEYGDGLISVGNEHPPVLERHLAAIRDGAKRVGRTLPDPFFTATLTSAVVLRPGEKLTSDRVIDECGSQVAAVYHFAWEIWKQTGNDAAIPEGIRDRFEEYCDYVERMEMPAEKRYLQIHLGHCTFLMPEERRFITPKAIQTTMLAGTPDEILERLRAAEKAGLRDVSLLPPREHARKVIRDFAEQVIARY